MNKALRRLRILVGQLMGARPPAELLVLASRFGQYSQLDWAVWCDGWGGWTAEEWFFYFINEGDYPLLEWAEWELNRLERAAKRRRLQ